MRQRCETLPFRLVQVRSGTRQLKLIVIVLCHEYGRCRATIPGEPGRPMAWIVEPLGPVVDAVLAVLPKDMQAAFLRLAEHIEAVGPEQIGQPHVGHLRDKLWEMWFSGRDGIARAVYVTAIGRRVVVVHVFMKKTRRAPQAALNLAERRAKEIKP